MFATLDPTSRRLRLPIEQEVIINDTVGFIRDLPMDLVAAFRATLEEITESNLLIHVVDASNLQCPAHIESVDKILSDLNLSEIPQIVVLNKSDLLDETSLEALSRQISAAKGDDCVAISALNPKTFQVLFDKIGKNLVKNLNELAGSVVRI